MSPIASRLEAVRDRRKVPSVRAFWQRLAEGWSKGEGKVSYEAARAYHQDRDPPIAYLARVANVFNVDLRWLATGEGAMDPTSSAAAALGGWTHRIMLIDTESGDTADLPAGAGEIVLNYDALARQVAGIMDDPILRLPSVRAVFRAAWARLIDGCPDRDLTPEQIQAVGAHLLQVLRAPLAAWGFIHVLEDRDREIENFAITMLQGLMIAMPEPARGDRFVDLPRAGNQ